MTSGTVFPITIRRFISSDLIRRFMNGMTWLTGGAVFSRIILIISAMFVARILKQEKFGEYTMVRSTVQMFNIFASVGIGMTASKFIAEFKDKDKQRVGRLLGLFYFMIISVSICMSVILYPLIPKICRNIFHASHLILSLRLGLIMFIFSALWGMQNGVLTGLENFKGIARANFITGVLSFPLMVLGAKFGGLNGAIIGFAVFYLLQTLIGHSELIKSANVAGIKFSCKIEFNDFPAILAFSLPNALAEFLNLPVIWICNTILVTSPNGFNHLAVFEASNQWRMAILFVPMIVGNVNLPMLTKFFAEKDKRFKKMLFFNLAVNVGFTIISIIPLMFFSGFIMRGYGEEFSHATNVFICVLWVSVFQSLNYASTRILISTGRVWTRLIANVIWSATLIIFTTYFVNIARLGANGLAFAYLLSTGILSIVSLASIIPLIKNHKNA